MKGPWKPYGQGLFGQLFHILCCGGGMNLPGEMDLANAGEGRATGAEAAIAGAALYATRAFGPGFVFP